MHTLALGAPALDATTSAVISARSSNVPVLDATTRSTCPCSTRQRARYAHSLGVLEVQRPCNTRRHDGFATNYVVVAHNGFAVRALDEHLRSTRPRHPYSARCRRSTRTRSRSARLRSSRPRHPRSLAHVRKSKPRRTTALRRTTASSRSTASRCVTLDPALGATTSAALCALAVQRARAHARVDHVIHAHLRTCASQSRDARRTTALRRTTASWRSTASRCATLDPALDATTSAALCALVVQRARARARGENARRDHAVDAPAARFATAS